MKFDESLVNNVKVGDWVYGYDTLEELREAIEGDSEDCLYTHLELTEIPDKDGWSYTIYDNKTEDYHVVNYVYPITEFVEETNLNKFIRFLNRSKDFPLYREVVIEKFFELKHRSLLHGPSSREEDLAIDWSYDLQDPDYCKSLKKEMEHLSIERIRYLFSKIDMNARFVFHDENMVLMEIKDSKEVFNAIRDILLKFYNSLA